MNFGLSSGFAKARSIFIFFFFERAKATPIDVHQKYYLSV